MKMTTRAAIVAVILGGGAAAYYLLQTGPEDVLPPVSTPQPVTSTPPASAPPASTPSTPAPAKPEIRYPLPAASGPLPALGASDRQILDALREAIEKKWLALVLSESVVRRIVATVDALPGPKVPAQTLPVKPVKGSFITRGKGDGLVISPSNSERYAPYVRLAEATDAVKLADVYIRFYPLFQRAYEELGYPDAYFNDRLVAALDDLLAAPEPEAPIRLVQPGVLFEFADPTLEGRSAGQKIMIRMGRDNAAKIKPKLRDIRREVTNRQPG